MQYVTSLLVDENHYMLSRNKFGPLQNGTSHHLGDLDDLGERFCEDNDAFYIEPDVEEDPAGIPGLAPLISFFQLAFCKKNTF